MKLYRRFFKYIGDSLTFISDFQNISTYRQKLTIQIGCSIKGTAYFSLYFFKGVTVQYVITRQIHSNGPILKIFIQTTLNTI
ncbi:hypothetical protein CR195_000675 [Bacillus cereus]|nr:hypothetical protein CR195_000675 [Bacillus cereus]